MSLFSEIPKPDELLKASQSLAMLDALYSPQWDLRYFSHNSNWAESQQMGSMRNGEGDDYFILFAPFGTAIKGCYLKSNLSGDASFLRNISKELPTYFSEFTQEPAFSMDEASFVLWFDEAIKKWQSISHPSNKRSQDDGSEYLTQWLRKGPQFYKQWAEKYYEQEINLELVNMIFQHQPLNNETINSFGLDVKIDQLMEDINEIGYPNNFKNPA